MVFPFVLLAGALAGSRIGFVRPERLRAALSRRLLLDARFPPLRPAGLFWLYPRHFQVGLPGIVAPRRSAGQWGMSRPNFSETGSQMTALWVIIACGALSIVYGAWATQSVMSADAGSQKMQEISAAVREGAQAYLKRQYTTIGIVGVVIFIIVGFFSAGSSRSDF